VIVAQSVVVHGYLMESIYGWMYWLFLAVAFVFCLLAWLCRFWSRCIFLGLE
jgi:hypothetical protein